MNVIEFSICHGKCNLQYKTQLGVDTTKIGFSSGKCKNKNMNIKSKLFVFQFSHRVSYILVKLSSQWLLFVCMLYTMSITCELLSNWGHRLHNKAYAGHSPLTKCLHVIHLLKHIHLIEVIKNVVLTKQPIDILGKKLRWH